MSIYKLQNFSSAFVSNILILSIVVILLANCRREKDVLNIEEKTVTEVSDIAPVDDSLVKPVDYTVMVSLSDLETEERKQKFIEMLLPPILIAKFNVDKLRQQVEELSDKDTNDLRRKDRQLIDTLLIRYRAGNMKELLIRLNSHPASIVIAQAALESAWGTSRFFYEANNPFGIWSFYDDEPRIASLSPRDGNQVYLKKFGSLSEAAENYFFTMATGPYSEFRKARLKTVQPKKLIPYLYNYSEKRSAYPEMLADIIRQNGLTRYDHYIIDPSYID